MLSSLLALFLLLGGGARLHAQTIAVMVNGEPITNFDIEQRAKLNSLTGGKNPDRKAISLKGSLPTPIIFFAAARRRWLT